MDYVEIKYPQAKPSTMRRTLQHQKLMAQSKDLSIQGRAGAQRNNHNQDECHGWETRSRAELNVIILGIDVPNTTVWNSAQALDRGRQEPGDQFPNDRRSNAHCLLPYQSCGQSARRTNTYQRIDPDDVWLPTFTIVWCPYELSVSVETRLLEISEVSFSSFDFSIRFYSSPPFAI